MPRSIEQASSSRNFSQFLAPKNSRSSHSSPGRTPRSRNILAPDAHSTRLFIHENQSQFLVSVELSDYSETSFDLWIEDHQLTLIADQKLGQAAKTRPAFFRCIDLPNDVDEDSIRAELKDAHLEISFEKDLSYPTAHL